MISETTKNVQWFQQLKLFSGLFSQCDKKTCLSVGLYFNAVKNQRYQGLVSYGQCPPSSGSWEIAIRGGSIEATIAGYTLRAAVSLNTHIFIVIYMADIMIRHCNNKKTNIQLTLLRQIFKPDRGAEIFCA